MVKGVPHEEVQVEDDSDEGSDAANDESIVCHISYEQRNRLEEWLGGFIEHPPTDV
jgi:hypothetical protein